MLASSSEEVNRRFLERIPMNRFGTPEEVADAVHFLVSEASTYITGEILDVNGGILMD
jgi:3-oxoacyl-[acyl-carrier protein] reductase